MLTRSVILVLLFSFVNSQEDFASNETQTLAENQGMSGGGTHRLTKGDKLTIDTFLKLFASDVLIRTKALKEAAMCQTKKTCSECTKSGLKQCHWCHDFGCTEIAEKLCPTVLYNASHHGKHNTCPFIKHSEPILVPAGIRSHISFDINIPDPALFNKEIICQIKLRESLTHLKGMIIKDTVYCYPVTLGVAEFGNTETGAINLIWGGAEPYSNELSIKVYRCESLAIECEMCKTIPNEYGCGWCYETNSCVTSEKCPGHRQWTLSKLHCDIDDKKMLFV